MFILNLLKYCTLIENIARAVETTSGDENHGSAIFITDLKRSTTFNHHQT